MLGKDVFHSFLRYDQNLSAFGKNLNRECSFAFFKHNSLVNPCAILYDIQRAVPAFAVLDTACQFSFCNEKEVSVRAFYAVSLKGRQPPLNLPAFHFVKKGFSADN